LALAFCLPVGRLLDHLGLRWTTAVMVALLGAVVWRMSVHHENIVGVFALVLLTRALGQIALSVASITAVGKSFGHRVGMAMASILFCSAFLCGGLHAHCRVVREQGWRTAWGQLAFVLLIGHRSTSRAFSSRPGD